MKSEKGEKGKPAVHPGAQRARSSKLTSMRRIPHSRASSFSIQPEDVSLTSMLETLKPHDHLCLIYESTEEWRACVVLFISIGLKRGEKCGYIVDTSTATEIRKYLAEGGVDVASVEKSGQLFILSETEVYTKGGSFDPDRMIALLIAETEKAIAEGYPALRITGEMTWVLRGHPGSERLLEYEAKLNRDFSPKYPCVAICQYDRWKFDTEIIKGVIMTHPLLVRGNKVYHNFYYIPPGEFLSRKRAETEVQHWFNNLEREQQIGEMLRSSEYEKATVLAAMSDLVIYQDLGHRVVWSNKAAGESVGLAPEDLLGRYCYEIWHQRSLPCVNCPVARARETGKPQENEASSPDGRFWLVRGYPVIGPDGVVSGAIEVTQDITKRKRAEEALIAEATRRQILIEQSRDGIVVLDENGKVYEVNQRFADMLGYSVKEASELHVWDWEFQFPREQVQEMIRAVDEKGDHFETRHRRKDGTTYDVEISTNGAVIAGHKLIFCVCRDITERKHAEEALRRSEQNFRDSMESSPLGIRIIDIAGKTLYANRALLDMWGYNSIEELETVPAKQRYTPESYAEHMERAKKGRGENVPLDYEVSIVRSDGQVRQLSAYTRALLWNGERQFQVVYQEVTERKKVELELQEERMKLKEAQAMGKIGNWEYDADSQRITWSDEVYVLYERDPALGPPTAEEEARYYSTEQAKKLRDYAERAIKSGEEFKYDMEVNLPSGKKAIFTASMRSIKNESGRVIRLFGTVQDITERKRQEEERRQLEQKAQLTSRLASVGEMAAGIAHEINNPLTSVIGYSQLLSGRKDITEDVKADLKAIDEGAQRVAGIIKRLLTFARQSKPERAFVNINDLITNTLDLRAYHLRTNNIKVTTKLATDLPLTTADPAQLQQVFLNIIVNAETAMTQANGRGKLLVKTEEVNGTIRISFKDNGSGIAKKNLERIFDPFFTTREVDQGTGLGLSICHGIIAEHKGRIWAESTLGRGATFMVELPIVTGSIQLEMAESSGKKLKKVPKARILVVDDEPSTLEFLSRLLVDEGHDVETVNNADEALEIVKNRRYSLILLDIKMPGTSGIELYGRMQKIALSLAERVIFITGDVMGTDTETFLSKTKAPYITKPFDVQQLKKKIERFLTGD